MKDIVALTIVFALVMGGIWFGVFTATEAGAIGTIFTFLFALLRRKLTRQNLIQTLKNTINISGMAFAIIIGAQIFTFFITVSGLSQELAQWVTDLKISPIGVVIWIMIIYFVLGTAMDTITMILLTLPIFLGVIKSLGIDLIWFGVLVIIQVELANISPPAGMNLYVVIGMVKERNISTGTVFRGVLPFCLTMLIFTIIIIAFPQISLFLTKGM